MSDGNRGGVERVFREAQFVRLLGIELIASGDGWCETRIKATSALQQQHGFVHAGAVMTLADHTCGGAAVSTVPVENDVVTVENKTSF
ncbi:MAG TPA: PaaI family thioesterase, partial [Candidatus Solibacter sp.]|nr:PaaI family thioesterase [Candidatus Solibacter sp.]